MTTNDRPHIEVLFEPRAEPEASDDELTPEEDGLSPGDEELARLLSQGLTQEAAGEAVGLSSRTVRRRLNHPPFRTRVAELRRQRVMATTSRLVNLSDTAIDTLEELLGSESDNLRFRAAQAVLAMGRRHYREDTIESDLAVRLEAIEELFDGVEERLR